MAKNLNVETLWDVQYKKGLWDVLKSTLEFARFEAVRKFIYQYSNKGCLLEVGCGIGILQAKLNKRSYRKYTGIDISKVAIETAKKLTNESTIYLKANMESYLPTDNFDLIIFNESVYYSQFPIRLIEKYFNFLTIGGKIIISIFETPNNVKILNDIHQKFCVIDNAISENSRGRWYCLVLKKKDK